MFSQETVWLTSLGLLIGGAAGVVSRITGSVGKGLAAITMDKEYQQKRREEMGRQPKDFGDSLARGGKGLLRVSFLLKLQETLSFICSSDYVLVVWNLSVKVYQSSSSDKLWPFCFLFVLFPLYGHQLSPPNPIFSLALGLEGKLQWWQVSTGGGRSKAERSGKWW